LGLCADFIEHLYWYSNPFIHMLLSFLLGLLTAISVPVSDSTDFSNEFIIQAHRLPLGATIQLDGVMNEPAWFDAPAITNFRQQLPKEGATPSERTEIRILYNEQYLYIGAWLYDSDPEGILAFQKRWDQGLRADDRFMWILDTFNDQRSAYFFEINPAGLMGDGLLTVGQGTNVNKAWNGIWEAKVTKTQEGWFAEIRIPFKTLDFNVDQSVWGINFQRTVRRKSEEILWAGWRLNQGLVRPQNAGKLIGLYDLSQGLNIEVKPYVMSKYGRSWSNGSQKRERVDGDAGFDVSYSLTPGIRTSLSVNTDFAEAEVDQRRVNLTRFPLVFPEQRSFFIEGSSTFSFVPSSGVTPFFSRRIGLVDGAPVPILFGARAIGRAGDTNIGFYQIRTGKSDINAEDFTVARVTQNIFNESKAGIIYTRRATLDTDSIPVRETIGADLELGTSKFMGSKNLQFQLYFVTHSKNVLEDTSKLTDRSTRGLRIAFPNFPFFWHASYREFGTHFDPAVGLAPRVGIRRFQPTIGYTSIFATNPVIRSLTTEIRYEHLMDMDWKVESTELIFQPLELVFESGEAFEFQTGSYYERLSENFDIQRNGKYIVPAGSYRHAFVRGEINTASFRRITGELSVIYEGYWTGTRTAYESQLVLRVYPGINLITNWNREDIRLSEGSFHADVTRFRGNFDITPLLAFTSIVQYDNLSELLGYYQRLHWIVTPGTDLYLVYTWNWRNIENRFSPLENNGSIKFSITKRF
jgi:hypothetical protein